MVTRRESFVVTPASRLVLGVAFVFGLAQFATTFLIAWLYSRHASTKLDPKAEAIKSRMEADA